MQDLQHLSSGLARTELKLLTGENIEDGYAVYRIQEIAFNNSQKLSSEDGFLQYMIERLLESSIIAEMLMRTLTSRATA